MAWSCNNHLMLMVMACMFVIALARPLSSENMASENMRTKEEMVLKDGDLFGLEEKMVLKDGDDIEFYDSVHGRILESNEMDYESGPNPRHGTNNPGGNSKWGGGGGKRPSGSP